MCSVRDIWVLWYVCHYKTFCVFRPQDGYFSRIYINSRLFTAFFHELSQKVLKHYNPNVINIVDGTITYTEMRVIHGSFMSGIIFWNHAMIKNETAQNDQRYEVMWCKKYSPVRSNRGSPDRCARVWCSYSRPNTGARTLSSQAWHVCDLAPVSNAALPHTNIKVRQGAN